MKKSGYLDGFLTHTSSNFGVSGRHFDLHKVYRCRIFFTNQFFLNNQFISFNKMDRLILSVLFLLKETEENAEALKKLKAVVMALPVDMDEVRRLSKTTEEQRVLEYFVSLRKLKSSCLSCGKKSLECNLIPCTGCGIAHYCSQHCKDLDWPGRHRYCCKLYLNVRGGCSLQEAVDEYSGICETFPSLTPHIKLMKLPEVCDEWKTRWSTSTSCLSCDKTLGSSFKLCPNCHLVRYCSEECRQSDWIANHVRACRSFKNVDSIVAATVALPRDVPAYRSAYLGSTCTSSPENKLIMDWNEFKDNHLPQKTCTYCGACDRKLQRCASCKLAHYCNRNCQLADWETCHKFLCSSVNKLDAFMHHELHDTTLIGVDDKKRCAACLRAGPGILLRPCARCGITLYCGDLCENNDKARHGVICHPVSSESKAAGSQVHVPAEDYRECELLQFGVLCCHEQDWQSLCDKASAGSVYANAILALCYKKFLGVPFVKRDQKKMKEHGAKCCDAVKALAASGDPFGCYLLAEFLFNGIPAGGALNMGDPAACAEQIRLLRRSADTGVASAQHVLALRGATQFDFRGLAPDMKPTDSYVLYKLAAEQGHPEAMVGLGHILYLGIGMTMKHDEALKWYRAGAELGYPVGLCALATCYEKGIGVKKDIKEAVRIYSSLVEKGSSEGQLHMGMCYEKGIGGVSINLEEAARLYLLSAQQGNSDAMMQLASCYACGKGVKKNMNLCIRWLRTAYCAGEMQACEILTNGSLGTVASPNDDSNSFWKVLINDN
jgi:TPR repeat protein